MEEESRKGRKKREKLEMMRKTRKLQRQKAKERKKAVNKELVEGKTPKKELKRIQRERLEAVWRSEDAFQVIKSC